MEKKHSQYNIQINSSESKSPIKKKSKTESMLDFIKKPLPRPISDNKEFCGKKIKSSKMKFTWEFAFEEGQTEKVHTIKFERSKISMRRILTHNDKVIWDSYGTMIGTFNYKFKLDDNGNYCIIKKENDYTIYINDVEFQKLYTLYYIQLVNEIQKPMNQEERKSYLEVKNINRRNIDGFKHNNSNKFRFSSNIKEAEDVYFIQKQEDEQGESLQNYNPFESCVFENNQDKDSKTPYIKFTESQYISV